MSSQSLLIVSTFINALITTGTISVPIAGNGMVGGALAGLNGGFAPSLDGFAVNNFTTQSVDVSLATFGAGGLCYGMTSFAAFYFNKLENHIVGSPSQHLYNYYFGETSPYMSNPIEQDIARELIFDTYILTYEDNVYVTNLPVTPGNSSYMAPNVVDSMTANTLLQTLQKENTPQLLTLYQIRNWYDYGFSHSVLVYGYSPPLNGSTLGSFLIYDPTWPITNNTITYDIMRQKFQPYIWPFQQASFANGRVYSSPTVTYTLFTFDAISNHFSTTTLQNILTSAQSGWPDKYFNTIPTLTTIAYVDGQPASDYPDNTYAVDPSRNIVVNGSVQSDATDTTSGAYFYINGGYIGYAPITNGRFNSDNLVLYGSPTLSIPSGTCSAELVTIVSAATGSVADGSQEWGISTGYTGFLRETVLLPLCGSYTAVAYSFNESTPQNATPAQDTPLPSPLGFRDDFETITFDGVGGYAYTKTRNTDGTLSTSSGIGTYVIEGDGNFTTSEGLTGSLLADGNTTVLMTLSGNPQIGVGILNRGILTTQALLAATRMWSIHSRRLRPRTRRRLRAPRYRAHWDSVPILARSPSTARGVYTYTMTQNTDGTLSTVSSSGTYSVAADGTFTTSEGQTGSVLANGSTFVFMTQDGNPHIGMGINNGGNFSNPSLTGDYACVAYSFNESALQNVTPAQGTPLPSPSGFRDELDTITFDGVGGYTYTSMRNTDGTLSTVSKSGTYSVAVDGIFTTSEGQIGSVIADGSTFVFMTQNGNPQIGVGIRW